jgi:Tfp pilus assembly protein PilF
VVPAASGGQPFKARAVSPARAGAAGNQALSANDPICYEMDWPKNPQKSLRVMPRDHRDLRPAESPPAGNATLKASAERKSGADKTLVGWKDIARFFARTESTVKRWEASRGLPVHRVPGSAGATVFAYEAELADWLKGRSPAQDEQSASDAGDGDQTHAAMTSRWPSHVALTTVLAFVLVLAGAGYLAGAWHGRAKVSAAAATSSDPQATQLYKSALFEWQTRTPAGLRYAVKDFEGAIARDPHYAMAYAGLADCYNLMREFTPMPPEVAYPRAKAAAERAIALDPSIAEAHAALAFDDFYWSRDEANARRQFEIALKLDPDSADIHHWYATVLMTVRAFPQAVREIEEAARLDPASTAILADKGLILVNQGRRAEGIALLQRLEQTQPQFLSPHDYLSDIYFMSGNDRVFLEEIAAVARLRGDAREKQLEKAATDGFAAGGRGGMLSALLDAQKQLYQKGQQSAYQLALSYADVKDWKDSVEYLKISLARHEAENIAMAVSPEFAQMRNETGFRALLLSAGLATPS